MESNTLNASAWADKKVLHDDGLEQKSQAFDVNNDLIEGSHCVRNGLLKVVPYTFIRRGVPVREDTYPEPSACEVGWPVPFLAAFISPVFLLGIQLLLGEQCASVQSGHQVGLEP